MLYFYRLHAGPSLILVGHISLDEYYYVSPVNICWLRHLTGACLDINLVFFFFFFLIHFYLYWLGLGSLQFSWPFQFQTLQLYTGIHLKCMINMNI